jgi:hypothetical protein
MYSSLHYSFVALQQSFSYTGMLLLLFCFLKLYHTLSDKLQAFGEQLYFILKNTHIHMNA